MRVEAPSEAKPSAQGAGLCSIPLSRKRRLERADWWAVRRAQNRKPATYTCPLCGGFLPALSEHMLLVPEGDSSRRRHAHTRCVMSARRAGRLPTRDEWLKAQRPAGAEADGGSVRRLLRRLGFG